MSQLLLFLPAFPLCSLTPWVKKEDSSHQRLFPTGTLLGPTYKSVFGKIIGLDITSSCFLMMFTIRF
ncbi:hypothetical protein TNCV_1206541 [Trichonephila clavipes]|nr:hypothetical protein TNCV_1206541 [Trichonephila clavipes]